MLDRKHGPTSFHGFMVGIELEDDDITPRDVADKIGEALTWVEHIGDYSIDHLGVVESIDEDGTLEVSQPPIAPSDSADPTDTEQ